MLDTLISSVTYNGNDVTTSFSYLFKIFLEAEMEVWLTDAAGAETQIASSNYTVLGAGDDAGGSVSYPVAGDPVATGEKLTLRRILAVKQDFFDPSNNTAFQAEVLETSADKTLAIIQQVKTDVDRSLRGSLASDIDPELPEAEAGKVLAWNPAADGIVNLGVSSVIPAGSIGTADITDDAVTPAKIAAAVAGDGLAQAVGGALEIEAGGNAVSVSANDTTPGVLNGKLVAGDNISLTEGNDGADETLTINTAFRGAKMYLDSSGDSVADSTTDGIDFTDEEYDTDGFIDIGLAADRITIPANVSWVRFTANVSMTYPAISSLANVHVQITSSAAGANMPIFVYYQLISSDGGALRAINLSSSPVAVSQGDYFIVSVFWNDVGGSQALAIGGGDAGSSTWFSVEVIE